MQKQNESQIKMTPVNTLVSSMICSLLRQTDAVVSWQKAHRRADEAFLAAVLEAVHNTLCKTSRIWTLTILQEAYNCKKSRICAGLDLCLRVMKSSTTLGGFTLEGSQRTMNPQSLPTSSKFQSGQSQQLIISELGLVAALDRTFLSQMVTTF